MKPVVNFSELIGHTVLATVPILDKVIFQELLIRGVEGGGVWVESQNFTEMLLKAIGQSAASKNPVVFLPFQQILFAFYPEDAPALSEKSFGM